MADSVHKINACTNSALFSGLESLRDNAEHYSHRIKMDILL